MYRVPYRSYGACLFFRACFSMDMVLLTELNSNRKRLKKLIHLPLAVSKRFQMNSRFVQKRQVQVRQWGRLRVSDMPSAFHPGCAAASDEDRQICVVMNVGIADAAAVKVKRVIQQRAIAFFRGHQFRAELREEGNMELIDLRHPRNFVRVVAVMREWMMRVRHPNFRVGAVAGLARELERDDARD